MQQLLCFCPALVRLHAGGAIDHQDDLPARFAFLPRGGIAQVGPRKRNHEQRHQQQPHGQQGQVPQLAALRCLFVQLKKELERTETEPLLFAPEQQMNEDGNDQRGQTGEQSPIAERQA